MSIRMFTSRCCIRILIPTTTTIGTSTRLPGMATSRIVTTMSTVGCATGMRISPIFITGMGITTVERAEDSHETTRFQGPDVRLLRNAHRLGNGVVHGATTAAAKGRRHSKADEALATFARHESAQEAATPEMVYSELLAEVHRRLARDMELSATLRATRWRSGSRCRIGRLFPIRKRRCTNLQRYYKLVILSNVDRETLRGRIDGWGVAFDAICTAQDIGSYKPDPRNFAYLINTVAGLGVLKRNILHTAQSLHHDHVPAQAVGLTTAWIDRRHQLEGWGATSPPAGTPRYDFRFPSLAEMVVAHQGEMKG